MSVYIWAATKDDYSAMRGPCPEGFHVPTYDDWDAMPNGSENLFQLYHLPPGFEFSSTSLRVVENASTADYRICNRVSVQTNQSTAQVLRIYSGWWANHYPCSIVQANHIRPFKDRPAYPDSTWTKVYEEEDECEVYHNATLWLITVHYYSTDDGWIRKTMADKNLWATVLYNYWDTQSTANCGYIYQHWNNYWFDPQWTISTSSTVVDCTWYWPWNYYSNSTMRTSNWNQTNRNMRWWETWVSEDIAELKSAYIGDYIAPREPNANTVAYWPLNSTTTVNDQSWNWYNLTQHSWWFTTIDWVSCFYTNAWSWSGYLDLTSASLIPTWDAARTILFWIRSTWYSSSRPTYCFNYWWSDQETWFNVFISATTRRSLSTNNTTITWWNTQFNTRQLIVATSSWNTFYLYVDWAHKQTATTTQYNINTSAVSSWLPLVLMRRWGSYTNTQSDWYLSEVIIENRQRSDAEITAYYNHTKWNYWIS